jgi:enterochelin esterase-like enzyme
LILCSKIVPTIFGAIWLLSILSDYSHAQSGTLSVQSLFSQQLKRDWNFKIYLPAGYENKSDEIYPVIYLLHGSEGDEHAWDFAFPVIDSLITNEVIPPLIAIAPVTGTSWWVDKYTARYESAFIKDLIPEVDRQYRTILNRKGRGIAGYSMGGYGALRYALVYPEYFGAGMILSAALYHALPPQGSSARESGTFGMPFDEELWQSRNYPGQLEKYFEKKLFVPLFIATGDDDWNHDEDFTFNVEQQAVYLYGKIHKEGGSPAELRIINGGHTIEVWKKSIVEGLQYMFRYLDYSK